MANGGIGEQIAAIRRRRNMTQEALAKAAGMSRPQLAAIESGRTVNPGVFTLIPLARVLAVTLDELVGAEVDGPALLDAHEELMRRIKAMGLNMYEPMDADEFARWTAGTSLTTRDLRAAVRAINAAVVEAPDWARTSTAAGYFVCGAAAGALVERWRA